MSGVTCATFGKGAAYVGYNVPGVSFIIGLVRLAVAGFFLARLHIDRKYRPQSFSVRSIDFDQNKAAWKEVAFRGGFEMIPIVGPAFLTSQDYKTNSSILQLESLKRLIAHSW